MSKPNVYDLSHLSTEGKYRIAMAMFIGWKCKFCKQVVGHSVEELKEKGVCAGGGKIAHEDCWKKHVS